MHELLQQAVFNAHLICVLKSLNKFSVKNPRSGKISKLLSQPQHKNNQKSISKFKSRDNNKVVAIMTNTKRMIGSAEIKITNKMT